MSKVEPSDAPKPQKVSKSKSGIFAHSDGFEDMEHTLASPATVHITKEVPRLKVMVITAPEAGHLVPLVHIALELAKRKHAVQLVTCAWADKKVGEKLQKGGVEFCGVAEHVKPADSGEGPAAAMKDKDHMIAMFMYYDEQMYEPAYALAQKVKPDIIVADFVTPCSWMIAQQLGIKRVINVPGPISLVKKIGESYLAWAFFSCLLVMVMMPRPERLAHHRFIGTWRPTLFEEITLINSYFGFEAATPLRPNCILTGPTAPRMSAKVVTETSDKALNEFIERVRKEGKKIIYVTMGSMQVLTKPQVDAIYDGLKDCGCAIVWALKKDQQVHLPGGGKDVPQHFYAYHWLPQVEILQLQDVAAVLTHCGWGGLHETINAGKPLIATPFRADQPENAAVVASRGAGILCNGNKMTASGIKNAATKILADPSYLQQAQMMQRALLKTSGAEKCAETIELIAQHGGEELVTRTPSTCRKICCPCRRK